MMSSYELADLWCRPSFISALVEVNRGWIVEVLLTSFSVQISEVPDNYCRSKNSLVDLQILSCLIHPSKVQEQAIP